MKTLLNKIDALHEKIEMGFYLKAEAMFRLRELRSEVCDKYEEGSDNFTTCLHYLIDAHETCVELYKL